MLTINVFKDQVNTKLAGLGLNAADNNVIWIQPFVCEEDEFVSCNRLTECGDEPDAPVEEPWMMEYTTEIVDDELIIAWDPILLDRDEGLYLAAIVVDNKPKAKFRINLKSCTLQAYGTEIHTCD